MLILKNVHILQEVHVLKEILVFLLIFHKLILLIDFLIVILWKIVQTINVHIYLELIVLALGFAQVMIHQQLPLKDLKQIQKLHNVLLLKIFKMVIHVWEIQQVAKNVKHKHVKIIIHLQLIVPIMHLVVYILILNVTLKQHVIHILQMVLILLLNKHGVKV